METCGGAVGTACGLGQRLRAAQSVATAIIEKEFEISSGEFVKVCSEFSQAPQGHVDIGNVSVCNKSGLY